MIYMITPLFSFIILGMRNQPVVLLAVLSVYLLYSCGGGAPEQLVFTDIPATSTALEIESPEPSAIITNLPVSTAAPITTLPPVPRDRMLNEQGEVTTSNIEMCSPLTSHAISQLANIVSDAYNPPPNGREERHHGVDFSYYQEGDKPGILGEGVQAIFSGVVVSVQIDRIPYGNMVIVETEINQPLGKLLIDLEPKTGQSIYHLYAHMVDEPIVHLGESVFCGQALGAVGQSGGPGYEFELPHLHLEMRIGPSGVKFPGMAFYDTRASITEIDAYKQWRTSGEFRHFDPMSLFSEYLEMISSTGPVPEGQ